MGKRRKMDEERKEMEERKKGKERWLMSRGTKQQSSEQEGEIIKLEIELEGEYRKNVEGLGRWNGKGIPGQEFSVRKRTENRDEEDIFTELDRRV